MIFWLHIWPWWSSCERQWFTEWALIEATAQYTEWCGVYSCYWCLLRGIISTGIDVAWQGTDSLEAQCCESIHYSSMKTHESKGRSRSLRIWLTQTGWTMTANSQAKSVMLRMHLQIISSWPVTPCSSVPSWVRSPCRGVSREMRSICKTTETLDSKACQHKRHRSVDW